MLWRIRQEAAPLFCLVLSSLWLGGIYLPYFYSAIYPNREIQHVIGVLEGHETPEREMTSYVQQVTDTAGRLKHAVRVAANYRASAEYKHNQSHTSKRTQYIYLAWFEKRSKGTVFVVSLNETDGSALQYDMSEGEPFPLAQALLLPLIAFSSSLYWFLRKRSIVRQQQVSTAVVGS